MRCEDCDSWLFVYKSLVEGNMGTCDNVLVNDQVKIDQEHEDDEIVIHTAASFGCKHFMRKGGNIVSNLPDLSDL